MWQCRWGWLHRQAPDHAHHPTHPTASPDPHRHQSRHPHLGQSHHHPTLNGSKSPNVVETLSTRMPPDLGKHQTTRHIRVREPISHRHVYRLGLRSSSSSCPGICRTGHSHQRWTSSSRTIARWATQITNSHHSAVSNGPTEGLNNLIKRIKPAAFGSGSSPTIGSDHFSTGKPNRKLLATITPPDFR